MARDILGEFGPDEPFDQKPRATNGGHMTPKPTSYSPPVGPTTFDHQGPGLANHTNHDNCGTQGRR